MIPDRKQVEEIYRAALEQPAPERLKFVAARCSGDDELRRAVEAWLARGNSTELVEANAETASDVSAASKIAPGVTIGNYRVDGLLGRGGMGVVYRATDARLNRPVAIKFLSETLLDTSARRRFQREAQMASALNHPHILTVHDVGDYEGSQYLVTEFVDGGTLGDWVCAEPRTWRQIAELMIGVADALAAAHGASILHRDIKPANILVSQSGYAKLADFGLAKPATDPQLGPSTEYTRAGAIVGTFAYMSPEQLTGRALDARSDIFAFGIVLYEMLAGRRPFAGDTDVDVMHAVVHDEPDALPADVPEALGTIVLKAIEKDPAERYQSMREVVVDLKRVARRTGAAVAATVEAAAPSTVRPRSRRSIVAAAAVLAGIAAVAGYFAWNRADRERWAREEAVPTIGRLTDAGKYGAAFALAQQASAYAPNDAMLRSLTPLFSLKYAVTSTPSEADVFVRGYADEGEAWQRLGRTPLAEARVARRPLRWRFEKDGYEPAELATSQDDNTGPNEIAATLQPLGTRPGMVFVPGGLSAQYINGALMPPVQLEPFFIDRYEVTNAEYKEFVDAGGYERQSFWDGVEIVKDGAPLAWADAMRLFVDVTGRRGPATWELGDFAEGKERYPVTGISWYEAAAYARFRGKALPTSFHWTTAALPRLTIGGLPASIIPASNFGSGRLAAVGTFRGMGPYGTFDMHGNASEWTATHDSEGRVWVHGGSWQDAAYNFFAGTSVAPLERSPTIGFRLMQEAGSGAPARLPDTLTFRRPPLRGGAPPVSDEVYAAYASQFAYTSGELNATKPVTAETKDDWTTQRVTVDTGYGERMDIVLFIPTRSAPPYQALLYFPPADTLLLKLSSTGLQPGHPTAAPLDFIMKSGRVLVNPIYQGTFERFHEPLPFTDAAAMQRRWVDWRRDVGRTIDYLETRGDIDSERIGYLGVSFGGTFPLHLPALESRFRVAMLVSGGTALFNMAPSIDPANYAPRIRIPVLQVNGRFDYTNPIESQNELFELIGTPAQNKRHVVVDAGHVIPRSDLLRASLDWLDEYLGPVRL